MNKTSYNGALIGAGKMGKTQALAFKSLPEISLKGVVDINENQAEKLASELEAKPFSCFEALVEEGNIDFIIVATPPTQRVALYKKAIERGIAVLLEKPIAASHAESLEMAQVQRGTGVFSAVGYCHRFVPATQAVLRIKEEKSLGAMLAIQQGFLTGVSGRTLRENWMSDAALSGGGVLMDTVCHSIDLSQFLGGQFVQQHAFIDYAWEGRAETTANLHAVTEEGVMVDLWGSWDHPVPRAELRVTFEHGEVYYNYGLPHYTLRKEGCSAVEEIPIEGIGRRIVTQAQAFIDALGGKETTLSSIDDAVSVAKVIDACYSTNR